MSRGLPALLLGVGSLLVACAVPGCRGGGELVIPGTIEARDAELASRVGGRIVRVYAREGERVVSGQLLVEFDSAAVRARLEEFKAAHREARARLAELERGTRQEEVAKARARVVAARARAKNARSAFARVEQLHRAGVVSDDDFDEIKTLYETAEALVQEAEEELALLQEGPRQEKIEAARAAVARAKARLRRVVVDLKEARLEAPWAGVLEVFDVEPGDFIKPGAAVARITDPERLWVRAYVSENFLGFVPTGAEVGVRVDSFPGRTYKGRVQRVATEAEFTPRTVQAPEDRALQVFAVRVDLLEIEGLRAGMAAEVVIPRGASSGGYGIQ